MLPSIGDLRLRDFVDKVKGSLDTFITDRHTRAQSFVVCLAVELQQVQRVCACDCHKVARTGPRNLIGAVESSQRCSLPRYDLGELTLVASTSILLTNSPVSQSQKSTYPLPLAPSKVPP